MKQNSSAWRRTLRNMRIAGMAVLVVVTFLAILEKDPALLALAVLTMAVVPLRAAIAKWRARSGRRVGAAFARARKHGSRVLEAYDRDLVRELDSLCAEHTLEKARLRGDAQDAIVLARDLCQAIRGLERTNRAFANTTARVAALRRQRGLDPQEPVRLADRLVRLQYPKPDHLVGRIAHRAALREWQERFVRAFGDRADPAVRAAASGFPTHGLPLYDVSDRILMTLAVLGVDGLRVSFDLGKLAWSGNGLELLTGLARHLDDRVDVGFGDDSLYLIDVTARSLIAFRDGDESRTFWATHQDLRFLMKTVELRLMAAVTIRRGRREDAAALEECFQRCSSRTLASAVATGAEHREGLGDYLAATVESGVRLLAVDPDGNVIGEASARRRPTRPSVAELGVLVEDRWRYGVVAHELVWRLIKRCLEVGVETVVVGWPPAHPAVEYLKRLGAMPKTIDGQRVLALDVGTEAQRTGGSRP